MLSIKPQSFQQSFELKIISCMLQCVSTTLTSISSSVPAPGPPTTSFLTKGRWAASSHSSSAESGTLYPRSWPAIQRKPGRGFVTRRTCFGSAGSGIGGLSTALSPGQSLSCSSRTGPRSTRGWRSFEGGRSSVNFNGVASHWGTFCGNWQNQYSFRSSSHARSGWPRMLD